MINKILTFFIKILFILTITLTINSPALKCMSFQEPDPEAIEKMLKELEEIFGNLDDDDFKPIGQIEPAKPQQKVEETAPAIPTKKLSKKENFLNAAKPEEKKQVVQKLPKDKVTAFYYFMNKFMKNIRDIEKQVDSFNLGIRFKEKLESVNPISYKKIVTSLETEWGLAQARGLYQKIFFLPTYDETRKQIIAATKKSRDIVTKLDKIKKEKEQLKNKKVSTLPGEGEVKKEIVNLFKNEIPKISLKLTEVTTGGIAKTAIEEKKKNRELMEKKTQEELAKIQRYAPRYSPGYSGLPWSSGGGYPYRPSRGSGYSPSYYGSSPYSYYGKPTDRTASETGEPSSGSEKKDKDKDKDKDKKKEPSKKQKISNETKNLIESVLKIYKENDPATHKEILDNNYMSKISSNLLDLAAQGSDKKLDAELKKVSSKKLDSELEKSIKKFLRPCIILSKYPSEDDGEKKDKKKDEQKEATIITTKIKEYDDLRPLIIKEIEKYNQETRKSLELGNIEKYPPEQKQADIDFTIRKIKIAFNPPIDDQEKISEIENKIKAIKLGNTETATKLNYVILPLITTGTNFEDIRKAILNAKIKWPNNIIGDLEKTLKDKNKPLSDKDVKILQSKINEIINKINEATENLKGLK